MKILRFNKEIVFDKLTRTAQEAAEALGCTIGQIAKSIIFGTAQNEPVLVVASGLNRVDEKIIETEIGEKIFKADANFVKEKTGFVIGGVPPWGHKQKIRTFIDIDLNQYDKFWASSGKTNGVFELTFGELVKNIKGKILKISQ
jgi:prolyl-tRNA editing enzyme YbaK/EbsC (Cys-tRNA(Pro) deacylase)